MTDVEYGRIRIIIDRDNFIRFLHTRAMLNRTGDTAGNIQFRADRHPGLADLTFMGDKTRIDRSPAAADFTTKHTGQFINQFKIFL